jgi:hypothetical protein
MSDWSDDETDEPLLADHRNYYKVEKWGRDGMRAERMLHVGNSLDRARAIFQAEIRRRPRGRYTIRQRTRVLEKWPPQGWSDASAPAPGDYSHRDRRLLSGEVLFSAKQSSRP